MVQKFSDCSRIATIFAAVALAVSRPSTGWSQGEFAEPSRKFAGRQTIESFVEGLIGLRIPLSSKIDTLEVGPGSEPTLSNRDRHVFLEISPEAGDKFSIKNLVVGDIQKPPFRAGQFRWIVLHHFPWYTIPTYRDFHGAALPDINYVSGEFLDLASASAVSSRERIGKTSEDVLHEWKLEAHLHGDVMRKTAALLSPGGGIFATRSIYLGADFQSADIEKMAKMYQDSVEWAAALGLTTFVTRRVADEIFAPPSRSPDYVSGLLFATPSLARRLECAMAFGASGIRKVPRLPRHLQSHW